MGRAAMTKLATLRGAGRFELVKSLALPQLVFLNASQPIDVAVIEV
jgi:hypothetical protein